MSTGSRGNDTTYRLSASQVVSYDASVATTNGVSANIYEVRVVATTASWIAIGASPTAAADTADSHYLPANVPQIFRITPGQKVAFIKSTGGTAGIGCVSELTR
jgi:hypothetical protein